MALFSRRKRSDLPFDVDPKQINATIGAIAFLLPIVLVGYASLSATTCFMTSISHFYYTRVGGDILVGALSVVGAVMILFYVYRGDAATEHPAHSRWNARLAKLAGVFALGVAFIPTSGVGCRYLGADGNQVSRFLLSGTGIGPDGGVTGTPSYDFWSSLGYWATPDDIPFLLIHAHYISAAGMFAILAYFSLVVFTKVQTDAAVDRSKPGQAVTDTKWWRNALYYVFGGLIVASMAVLGLKMALVSWILDADAADRLRSLWDTARGTFWCEAVGLMAFGASWAIKGRLFGMFEDPPQPASASRAT